MTTLLVGCGALSRELIALRDEYEWDAVVLALPVLLHNTPARIPAAVRERIEAARADYHFERVIVAYGDCGTSGALDVLVAELGGTLGVPVERIAGPHCYEQYAGAGGFAALMDEALGTYFLTDYLVQSFDHLVLERLGLDRYPELRDMYFGNYTRVVYLQQRENAALSELAAWAAEQLQLPLEVRATGYGALETRLLDMLSTSETAMGAR